MVIDLSHDGNSKGFSKDLPATGTNPCLTAGAAASN